MIASLTAPSRKQIIQAAAGLEAMERASQAVHPDDAEAYRVVLDFLCEIELVMHQTPSSPVEFLLQR